MIFLKNFPKLFLLCFISLNSQNQAKLKLNNSFLFTFQKDSYLITNDSLFCITENKKNFPLPLNLKISDYKFVSNDSVGYLKNRSNGIIYSFDGNKFKRLDRSFALNSQNFSFSFIYNNNLMDFGGYGLHTFKNNITYFDFDKKETELYPQISSHSDSPDPRHKLIGQLIDDCLYIGPGYGVYRDQESPQDNFSFINDYWKFSFKKSRWEKLGEGEVNISFPFYGTINDFYENTLVISEGGVYQCNILNNILIYYPNANLNIIKTLNRDSDEYKFTYNKFHNKFYFVVNKTNGFIELLSFKKNEFLGTEKQYSKLYQTSSNAWYLIILISILMLLIIMSVYLKLKVKNTHKIARKINRIKEDMKLEDFKILTKLLESSPNFINYSELSDVYSEHLGYESKKKKTRQSISSLEEYLTQKLKIKYPVFEFRKNKEDKREKQIRII